MSSDVEAARLEWRSGHEPNSEMFPDYDRHADTMETPYGLRNRSNSRVASPDSELDIIDSPTPSPWVSTLSAIHSANVSRTSSGLFRSHSLPTRGRYTGSPTNMSTNYQCAPRARLSREPLSTFEDIPLHEIPTTTAPLQTTIPPRSLRSSFHRTSQRMSLTPSEMPYPTPLHSKRDEEDKAEKLLGLRRSQVPPVPPKDVVTSVQQPGSSDPHLPVHESPSSKALPPQNGRTAWMHAFAAIMAVGNCWGLAQAFGLFQAYYTRYYIPWSNPSTIAWIGSTQLALMFGLGVPVGRVVDKGHFRLIFHGGSALVVLGVMATSWCKAFWSLWLVQGLLTGLGMGMVFCSGTLALMSWFDESKMGVAMGLGGSGSCIGGIVYVLITRHLLETKGFPFTVRILAAIVFATMIPPNLVFRMRGQTHKLPGRPSQGRKIRFAWRTFTSPAYLLATAGMFFSFLGVYFGFVYIVSFGSEILHLSDTAATNLLIYMLLANLPGRFIPGLISDRCIGPLNTIIPSALISGIALGLWTAGSGDHPSRTFLTVMACFYGFVSAGVQVLYASTVYSFCLETPDLPAQQSSTRLRSSQDAVIERIGLKAGGIFSCIGFACLVGTPIGGAMISYRVGRGMDQPYLAAQIFATVCLLTGGMLLLGSRICKIGWAAKRA